MWWRWEGVGCVGEVDGHAGGEGREGEVLEVGGGAVGVAAGVVGVVLVVHDDEMEVSGRGMRSKTRLPR